MNREENFECRCVLLVDDNEALLTVFETVLKGIGCKVVTAKNGVEGLERFKNNKDRFNIIISDIMMPIMDGIEMIHQIRLTDNTIPIAILSGYTNLHANEIARLNVKQYQKPIQLNELMDFVIQTIIGDRC